MDPIYVLGGLLILLVTIGGRALLLTVFKGTDSPVPAAPAPPRPVLPTKRPEPGGLRRLALHEAGHALVAWRSPYVAEVASAEFLYKDGQISGGAVRASYRLLLNDGLWDTIACILAGISAEMYLYDTTVLDEARSDLKEARRLAIAMTAREGRAGRQIPPYWKDAPPSEAATLDFQQAYAEPLPVRVQEIMDTCYRRARQIISTHEPLLHAVADALIEKHSLDENDFRALLGRRPYKLWGFLRIGHVP